MLRSCSTSMPYLVIGSFLCFHTLSNCICLNCLPDFGFISLLMYLLTLINPQSVVLLLSKNKNAPLNLFPCHSLHTKVSRSAWARCVFQLQPFVLIIPHYLCFDCIFIFCLQLWQYLLIRETSARARRKYLKAARTV